MAWLLVLLAVTGRLLPHPPNFTPVLATALFAGAVLPGRLAPAVPLLAMLASDLALGHSLSWISGVVYGCFLLAALMGRRLREGRTWGRTLQAALAGSLLFYLVTNFAVWLVPSFLYEHTAGGLLRCYVLALPFFRNALAGDLLWTLTLFGVYDLACARWRVRHAAGVGEMAAVSAATSSPPRESA